MMAQAVNAHTTTNRRLYGHNVLKWLLRVI